MLLTRCWRLEGVDDGLGVVPFDVLDVLVALDGLGTRTLGVRRRYSPRRRRFVEDAKRMRLASCCGIRETNEGSSVVPPDVVDVVAAFEDRVMNGLAVGGR